MQKENRKIQENEVSIHLFEDGYIFSDNIKSNYYKKSLFTKKNKPSEIESINLNETKVSFISFNKTSVFVVQTTSVTWTGRNRLLFTTLQRTGTNRARQRSVGTASVSCGRRGPAALAFASCVATDTSTRWQRWCRTKPQSRPGLAVDHTPGVNHSLATGVSHMRALCAKTRRRHRCSPMPRRQSLRSQLAYRRIRKRKAKATGCSLRP